ncbi:hypothetical protein [Salinithrix halophila]|uniref:Uncharacterized protein n=1 Tax=Salinithrix halophila TaxID=1485204 RepID=A0ABV8JH75_9BACL
MTMLISGGRRGANFAHPGSPYPSMLEALKKWMGSRSERKGSDA